MTGKELKEIRTSLGLTQTQLAEMCDVKLRGYQLWEAADLIPAKAEFKVTQVAGVEVVNAHKSYAPKTTSNITPHIDELSKLLNRAMDEIQAQRQLTEKAQLLTEKAHAQIDKLIDVIASNNK